MVAYAVWCGLFWRGLYVMWVCPGCISRTWFVVIWTWRIWLVVISTCKDAFHAWKKNRKTFKELELKTLDWNREQQKTEVCCSLRQHVSPHHNSRPINTAIIMVQKNVPKQNKELLFQWIQPTYTRWSSRPECWPRVQDLFACWNNWPHPKCFFVRETWYCFWRKQPNKIAS